MSRSTVRSLLVLVLVLGAGVAWFSLSQRSAQPPGQVAPAALSSESSPSAALRSVSSPNPAAGQSATQAPSPSPTPWPSSAGQPPRATRTTVTALSERLDSLRAIYGLPGVSAAIMFADGSIWRGTSGLADVKARRPVTPDTEFAVASISKTFLAALVLSLAEDGRIELEAPVTRYLPDLAIDPSITVRQLLDHTSGIRDYFHHPKIDAALLVDRKRVWTTADALRYVGKPYFKPGQGWHYSNTNYLILGMLAEAVGQAPLAAQLHARFLGPLGLDHTYYQGVDHPLGPLARAYRFSGPGLDLPPIALADGTDVVPFTSVVTAAGSAGSIASTAEDLVTWARALYGGHVLQPASLVAMAADVAVSAPFKPSVAYGLGVQAATVDGRPTLGHSGRLLGSRTVVRWLPDEGIAITVLTNQSRSDPNLLVRALLRVVLGAPRTCDGCPSPN